MSEVWVPEAGKSLSNLFKPTFFPVKSCKPVSISRRVLTHLAASGHPWAAKVNLKKCLAIDGKW